MKQTIVLLIFGCSLAYLLSSYASGPAANGQGNLTGARGGSGCSCHNSTSSIGTTVELDSAGVLVTTYHPGVSYKVKIKGVNNTTHTTLKAFGFQVSTVTSATGGTTGATQAGTWGTLPTSTHTTTTGSCSVVEQSAALLTGTTGGVGTVYADSIAWTAPVAGTGAVKIYGIINAVNDNNSSSGDYYQVATAVTITEAVAAALAASVNITLTTGSNPTCAGSSVTFTATPTNGGTAPSYQWKVNGTNAGTNSATYSTTTLATGSVVTCVMTSNLTGVTGSPATSNGITMTINPSVTPTVSISTANQTICAGTSATFTATVTNGGTTPSYQWKVNGANAGTNSATYTTTTLTNGQAVTCTVTSTATCASPATATSNSLTMTVNPSVTPSVSIATPNQTICSGTSVTFTATPTNGGAPSYQWKVNGTNAGTNSTTYTTTTLTNGQVVTCTMTSTATCAVPATATSNSITITVSGAVTPAVSITTPSTSTCAGSSVTFTATPTNGGTTPSYQWKVNGTNAGTNSPTFTTTTLTNGQIVTCVMTSNSACASPATATSNAVTMTIGTVTPAVSISTTTTAACTGTSYSFTATPTNGGTTPAYQWQVNGINAGTNSPTFTSTTLANGDVVSCVLTSSLACASPITATSNSIAAVINPTVVPTVTVTASSNSICSNEADSFVVTGSNLGTNPSYQWEVNGIPTGTNSPAYISPTLTNNSSVTCIVVSNAACAVPAQASSSAIISVVASPVVTITPSGAVTVCQGDSVLLTASGASNYMWTTSVHTQSIYVHLSGTYSVTGTDVSCSSAAIAPVVVSVDVPTVPMVSQSGNVITSTGATGYQWIENSAALPGDTNIHLTISSTGSYQVTTRDAQGCTATSITYNFTYVNGIVSISQDLGVKLYPIPNQGTFMIDGPHMMGAELAIYDIYGQKVYTQKLTDDHTAISGGIAAGVYFVTVTEGSRVQTIKMQVAK
jgi:hypothetical protein